MNFPTKTCIPLNLKKEFVWLKGYYANCCAEAHSLCKWTTHRYMSQFCRELSEAILFSINADQVSTKSVTMLLHNSMALFTSIKYGVVSDVNTP